MVKLSHFALIGVALCALFAQGLYAQGTQAQREEVERLFENSPDQRPGGSQPSDLYPIEWDEEELPAQLDRRKEFTWAFGGWARASFTSFDTPLDTDRTLRDLDVRAWADVNLFQHHQFYARFRTFYTDYNSGDAPGQRDDEWQALRVDQLFYQGSLARALGMDNNVDLDVTVGRQFMVLGMGAALTNVVEGVRASGRMGEWGGDLIAARTIHYYPDFDPTTPEQDNESDRLIFAANAWTTVLEGRKMYAYWLAQMDLNQYEVPGQAWDYNSHYFGLGTQGNIPLEGLAPNTLSYRSEFILQLGRSQAFAGDREDIFAWAWMNDVYFLPGDMLPFTSRGVLSWHFGSGDQDRSNQLGTIGGNRPATTDSAFNYLGFVNTGYVLAPRLTNLHMLRANFEGQVLKDYHPWVRELKVGSALYVFFKHHQDAPATDFTSNESARLLGTEMDFYVDYSAASDLDVQLRYGIFFPGNSYARRKARNFFSLSVSLSF